MGVNDFRFLYFSCVQNARQYPVQFLKHHSVTQVLTATGITQQQSDCRIHVPHFTFVLHSRVEHELLIKRNIKKRPDIVSSFQLYFN
jgi:hypothetical protein